MDDYIDPKDIPEFELPDKFLKRLFELSGDADNNKGFILTYVGQDGSPLIVSSSQNKITGTIKIEGKHQALNGLCC